MKSAVEIYWDSIRYHTNDPRDWTMLSTHEQYLVVESINLMLLVLNNNPVNQTN